MQSVCPATIPRRRTKAQWRQFLSTKGMALIRGCRVYLAVTGGLSVADSESVLSPPFPRTTTTTSVARKLGPGCLEPLNTKGSV